MKISWRLKLTIMTIATVIGAIVVTWLLNNFFLEDYYINTKLDLLKNTYESIEDILDQYQVSTDDDGSVSIDTGVSVCAAVTGGSSVVTTGENATQETSGDTVADDTQGETSGDAVTGDASAGDTSDDTSGSDTEKKEPNRDEFDQEFQNDIEPPFNKKYEIDLNDDSEDFLSDADSRTLEKYATRYNLSIYIRWNYSFSFSTVGGEGQNQVFNDRIFFYSKGNTDLNDGESIYTDPDNRYAIQKVYDVRTSSTYIELFSANTENGSFVLIRTSVESMQDSVKIANTFLIYAGLLAVVLACIIMIIASKQAVKPIEELSSIANAMTNMDFTAKYTGNSHDEIGKLGESINELSEKLEETISDLKSANNRLQSDIEQKTQIDEMRKEFLSNVTHELKTPIALISGYAEGLKDCINTDDESRDFYCDVIIDEAAKMNTMVKKLLSLNQIEFGRQKVELDRFDICDIITSVLNSSELLIKNKNIKLMAELDEGLFVWADAYMIEEVFTNYFSNAINHCENEMVIDVRAKRDKDRVRVSVFNTGKPIPEDEIDKIWIKFYKVDKARTREYGGSGIGLSIVKAIMDAHNEPFGVINHSNGVEFWFELDSNAKV